METSLKGQLMSSYLSQQIAATNDNELREIHVPTQQEMDEFKNYVKAYIEVDNAVKKLQGAIRERNGLKKQISQKITQFMSKFNIEDLNTNDGKLKYRVSKVKVPVRPKEAKVKLLEYFSTETSAEELAKKVFESDSTVEKHSLRRFRSSE